MRKWLRDKRKESGITQSKISSICKIAQPFYSDIEKGKRRPSPEVAKKIADALGFSWTKFFEEESA